MFFKPVHIFLVMFVLSLFLFQTGKAETQMYPVKPSSHPTPTHTLGIQHLQAQQIIMDSLTDSNEDNGDDETSSKSKHKHPRLVITHPSKFYAFFTAVFSLVFNTSLKHLSAVDVSWTSVFLSGKTPISIAIRCLKI